MKIISVLKKLIKPFTPVFLVHYLQKSRNPIKFEYGHSSWDSAESASVGYADALIIEKVNIETLKMLKEDRGWVRDGVYFDDIQFGYEVLSSLALISRDRDSLKVVDFGGALGSSYFQNKDILNRFGVELEWRIIEQEQYVRFGEETLKHIKNLSFFTELQEALGKSCDVIIFSSVLCYLENPYDVIRQAISSKNRPRFVIIDRTPMSYSGSDLFAVQKVGSSIHTASLPIRILSIHNILNTFGSDYEMVYSWDCDMQPDAKSKSKGLFLISK
jgi:putative methyltransferase (TIGR04325 family)